jgi:hypothetical protein
MWQIYSLLGITSNALEETLDKHIMLTNVNLDVVLAALIRNVAVLLIAFSTTYVFDSSSFRLLPDVYVLWWALLYAVQAVGYTYILKYVEITAAGVSFALLPLLFLPIDIFFAGASITPYQMCGLLLLVFGSIIFFSRDIPLAGISKSAFWFTLGGLLMFDAALVGSEGYIFKYYVATSEVSTSLFIFNGMLFMCLFLLIALGVRCLVLRGAMQTKGFLAYAQGSFVAKMADYGNLFFTFQALTIASVSQVSAMKTVHPIVLLCTTFIVQKLLQRNVNEDFSRRGGVAKTIGIVVIIVGSILVA